MNEALFSSSSILLCFVCNSPSTDPRLLPCQHSFCLKCIKFLCDNPTSDPSKKIKVVCPKCTTHFKVPSGGVESYAVDTKLQNLKTQLIDKVANNISNDIKSSREGLNKDPDSYTKYNMRSSRISSNSPLNKEYSKYAKYFESNDEKPSFKPTIRPDHAKVSYESSTRFRNRQRSKDREKSDEKEYRRRTWYGSTLENRRAQSLSRSSTYTESTHDPKSHENLYKISEDKEQPNTSEKSSYRHSMYADYSRINIPTTPAPPTVPMTTQPNDPSKPFESPFSRRANLGGPSRPTLATHRENIVTGEEHSRHSRERKNSRFSPLRNEAKFAYETKKNLEKMSVNKDKKRSSPSPSPQRRKVSKNDGPSSEKTYREHQRRGNTAPLDGMSGNKVNDEKSGERMDRREQFMKQQSTHHHDQPLSTHHHDQPLSTHHHDKPLSRQSNEHLSSKHRFKTEVQFEEVASHKKHRVRCRSMDARPKSLNKNDFKSASEFKDHLLGMTMKKDHYQNIMHDCNNIQDYEEEEEEKKNTEKYDQAYTEEDKENFHEDYIKKDSVIDENLITSLRAKYSSSVQHKRFPKQSAVLKLGEGVSQEWSYQKDDCGLPSSAVFLPSKGLVIADYGQSRLEFLDSNGHCEHNVTGIKPFGMAINYKTNSIIVGDRKGRNIRVFDEFGADVSQIDEFNSIEWLGGIGLKQDGGLVLCDRSKSRVIVCNSAGEKVREFGSYGSNPKQFCMADFIVVDSKDRVIIADSGNHCLKIFDSSSGELLRMVGGRGGGEGQFEWPKGVAVDDRDNILVADTLNRRVGMFSPDGSFIKYLVSSIPDPYNLSYHQGRLAILHHKLNGISTCDVYSCFH